MSESHPLEVLFQEELYHVSIKTCVVLSTPWDSIPETDKVLLTKILGALKLSLAAVQCITRPAFSVTDFKSNPLLYIISFGSSYAESQVLYEPMEKDGIQLILSESLTVLTADDSKRKNLWAGLKKMYGL